MTRSVAIVALLLLSIPASAGPYQMPAVHTSLSNTKAQANREEFFRHLMNGTTPSWLAGKSPAVIARRTTAMKKALIASGRRIVNAIVAAPDGTPTTAEQNILGLLSPAQRAQLLKEVAGFKVEKVKFKVGGTPTDKLKITLKRYATLGQINYWETASGRGTPEFERQMSIYNRVMGPNVVSFFPSGHHSKYAARGEVFDIWGMGPYGPLRPNNYTLFPTWLSDAESSRLKSVVDPAGSNWDGYLGDKLPEGRPGMWPPVRGQRKETGNSCTTVFTRAPIGERDPAFAWIDKLQVKIGAAARAGKLRSAGVDLKTQTLLQAVTDKQPAEYGRIFDAIKGKLPREAASIDKLRAEVDFFYKSTPYNYNYPGYARSPQSCVFPMDLMHRTSLAQMAKISGDPVGPGMATQKFRAGDPTRLGVVTVFEKAPTPR